MPSTLNRKIGWAAIYVEKYVLSAVYLYLAWSPLLKFREIVSGKVAAQTTLFLDASHYLSLVILGLATAILLLFAHRPAAPPDKLKLILIPLGTTFFSMIYFYVSRFPVAWRSYLAPQAWQTLLTDTGLACIIIGPLISLWGILHLGRSFGILVTVRKIILTGPYQWVRHPMYLGWICLYFGVAVVNFSAAYFLLVSIHISLLIYRAHLEETQLAEHSPEYRKHLEDSGFILPKLW